MNKEIKEILDNLAKKSSIYKSQINRGTSFNTDEYEASLLLDYITNLQEENKRLKEENKRIFSKVNDDELLISNAMNYAEAQDYKSRIDKAINILELSSQNKGMCTRPETDTVQSVLLVLNGGDEE